MDIILCLKKKLNLIFASMWNRDVIYKEYTILLEDWNFTVEVDMLGPALFYHEKSPTLMTSVIKHMVLFPKEATH